MATQRKTWEVWGKSTSGINYGPCIFNYEPKAQDLYNVAFNWDGDESVDGGGDYGSNVFLTVKVSISEFEKAW